MTITTHATAGMIVAQWTNNPVMGFFVAVASHYVLDIVPHGDEFIYWRHVHNSKDWLAIVVGLLDFLGFLTVVLAVLVIAEPPAPTIWVAAAFGGVLPDFMMTFYTNISRTPSEHPRTVFGRIRKACHTVLHKHYTIHMAFHNLIRTPIRFRSSLFYQIVFLLWFFVSYIPAM